MSVANSMADHITTVLPAFSSMAKPNVHFSDIHLVTEKLKSLIYGGKHLLQIITDFDRTLTIDDCYEPSKSTYGILEASTSFSETFQTTSLKLKNKYFEIERDPNLSVDDKIPYMVEWWQKSEQLFANERLKKSSIERAVEVEDIHFREGSDKMLKILNEHSIPVLIFSAGLGDVIQLILRNKSFDHPNVHVISNFFKFEDDFVTGYNGPIIHVFNKNEHAIERCEYFKELKDRRNVILMGDSLGDANMSEGVPAQETVLKIGFLTTKHVEAYLPQYLAKFDIVLVDDQTMAVPMLILDNILAQDETEK